MDIASDFAYIATAANAGDYIFDINSYAYVVVATAYVVDVALADDLDDVFAIGATPPKAHQNRQHPRSPYRFGSRPPKMLCPFNISSSFLQDPAIILRLQQMISSGAPLIGIY